MALVNVSFIANEEEDHSQSINRLLETTHAFDCIVAFAKRTGFGEIKDKVVHRLKLGMEARFFIGLSLYQTEPELLDELLTLKEKFSVGVFVSNPSRVQTFHPKIYRFVQEHQISLIVGSANLTKGGLTKNHEVSVCLRGSSEGWAPNFIERLIDVEDVVELDSTILSEYRKEYEINKLTRALEQRRAVRLRNRDDVGLAYLRELLIEMQVGGIKSDFSKAAKLRRQNRTEANRVLEKIANLKTFSAASFDRDYSRLAGDLWLSGGLLRQKSKIARRRELFRALCSSAVSLGKRTSVETAYERLRVAALGIVGVGPNIITEILGTRDNKRFAIMNQNSVAGLRIAGYEEFPDRPNKYIVDGNLFRKFCRAAETVRVQLGLKDLSELDALLDYAYWRQE